MKSQSAWIHIIAVSILFLGSIHLLLTGFNIRYRFGDTHAKKIAMVVGLVGLYLTSNRNAFLPFLGSTVYPGGLITQGYPKDAYLKVVITAEQGVEKIVYWAASPGNKTGDPESAYKNTPNVGVAPVVNGQAVINFMCPQQYKVRGHVLPKHIHYRYVFGNNMLGEVKTLDVKCS
ncbi:MAG: hypothetical protein EBU90_10795 [Proteobacteria bacterium]|nr:hypothetical protein [Pseudomonadota bacterium]NBP14655.1 hypothetical protein [bacterium]